QQPPNLRPIRASAAEPAKLLARVLLSGDPQRPGHPMPSESQHRIPTPPSWESPTSQPLQGLVLEIHRGGQRFHLARYFDFDRDARGPKALAKFLGLPVEEGFPIAYDVTPYAVGEKSALSGFIRAEPAIRLSEEEIIRAAVAIGRI